MKRYSAYKNSGVKWIGEIPTGWSVRKIKYIFNERSVKGYPDEPVLCSTQKYGVIPQSMYENRVVVVNKGLEGLKLVRKGDFVISLRSFQGGIEYAHYQGIISAAYTVLALNPGIDANFMKYLLKSYKFVQLLQTCVTGIREGQNINYGLLRKNSIALPSLPEQGAIVLFLDDKIGKIDHLTDQTTALIERLKELKQSVIARAVTRGLNPNVKMKPSGISWVGEIPKHWETKRFGSIFKLKTPISAPEEELLSVFLDKGVIYASESANRTHNASEDLTKYQLVEPTDFVMNNQQAWRGSVGVSAIKGIISPAYHIFKLPKCYDPTYANYLLRDRVMVNLFDTSSKGVGSIQRTLNFNWLNGGVCVIPPMNEQIEIAKYLNNISKEIDFFISKKMKEVGLLKELRQRTISDAVTGKIKVTD